MIDLWNLASLGIFDFLLGWLLYLPSDLVLFSLALITAGMMALVRPLATNQDLLRRVDEDRGRLKELMRQAKKDHDRDALQRFRATGTSLSLRKLRAEIKPLLLVILPVALLATWAMFRLEFHPPREGEPVEVVAYAPLSSVGDIMHILPRTGLEAVGPNKWVQPITIQANQPSGWDVFLARITFSEPKAPEPDAVATWTLQGKARPRPYSLLFRFHGQTIARELLIGQTTYSPPWGIEEKDPLITQIKMREVKLFGIVPGLGSFLPAWLVGYLIIVIPLVFLLKWLFRIY